MTRIENIFDRTLHHIGLSGKQPFFVAIGAMDGISFDDLHGYIRMYKWSGLLVEPVPEQFKRLTENFAKIGCSPNNKYENSAIADYDGTIRMLTINQDAIDSGEVHACFGGMSAIYPPRNGLASEGDAPIVEKYAQLIEVNCITLATLFRRHEVSQLDILCIDAEGWDYKILEQLDFALLRPKLIRCEYTNLSATERAALEQLLRGHEYAIGIDGQNMDAVAEEYWGCVCASKPANMPRLTSEPFADNLTLVTGICEVDSRREDARSREEFERRCDQFERLLQLSIPLIIFTQREFQQLILRCRGLARTHVVFKSLKDLAGFPFYNRLLELRRRKSDRSRASAATHDGPERDSPLRDSLALSKQFFLNDATIYNPFNTTHFMWVDADVYTAICDQGTCLTADFERMVRELKGDNRFLSLCRPIPEEAEFPLFSKAKMAEFAGEQISHFVSGKMFGGSRPVVNAINGIYYAVLAQSMKAGCTGTEEHIFTIISHAHRDLFNLQTTQMMGQEWA